MKELEYWPLWSGMLHVLSKAIDEIICGEHKVLLSNIYASPKKLQTLKEKNYSVFVFYAFLFLLYVCMF